MNKINSKEEFMNTYFDDRYECDTEYPFYGYSFPNRCKNQETLRNYLKSIGICMIPADDIRNGSFGFVFFKENNIQEESWFVVKKAFHSVTETIQHETFSAFKNAINEAIEKNHYIIRCDDPKKLILGYMIVCNNGSILHEIRIPDIKGTD